LTFSLSFVSVVFYEVGFLVLLFVFSSFMHKSVYLVGALLLLTTTSFGQSLDLNNMDVLLHDTLISKTDFMANVNALPASRAKYLAFAPPTDGIRTVYYLTGTHYAQGELKKVRKPAYGPTGTAMVKKRGRDVL
jgi:hypothetical protein